MGKIRMGIMGCGSIACVMAETVKKMHGITLYAAASRTTVKAETFAKAYGAKKAYGSYEEMLKDDKVDLVYIATPHSEHYANALLCIAYKKPMLIEKSFTANAAQAREVLKKAEDAGVFVTEAIWTRYMPMVAMIKEVLASGIIGEPKVLTANLNYNIASVDRLTNPALAGGALLDVGVYPLNFASIFFGDDVEEVSSYCTYTATGVDETETITLKYTDGRIANLTASLLCVGDRKGMIHCTNGYMVIENINNYESFSVYDGNHKKLLTKKAPKQISGYEYEVYAAMKAISEKRLACPEMPHSQTIHMMEMMDGLRASWNIKYPFE